MRAQMYKQSWCFLKRHLIWWRATLLTQTCAEISPSEVKDPRLLHAIPSQISKHVFFTFYEFSSEAEEYFFLVETASLEHL